MRVGEAVLELRHVRALTVVQVEHGNLLQFALLDLRRFVAAVRGGDGGSPLVEVHAGVRHLAGGEHEAQAAPRLALIQRDIQARLDWPQLSLAHIARLHHLTPRQVQRLFARQGTGFREYVSAARLDRARAQLADPAQRHRRVLEIALDCGFDDVSAFSQAFRRRFGMTPSEARHGG